MLSDPPLRVLAVCLGNICRSPLAERLLVARLSALGHSESFAVSSAGVGAMVGRPIHPEAAEQLVALGGSADGFAARQLDRSLVEQADLVLAATVRLRQSVVEEAPAALRRTFTLREFALLVAEVEATSPGDLVAQAARSRGRLVGQDLDIPDPMGRSREVHEEAARLAADAVDAIAAALAEAG